MADFLTAAEAARRLGVKPATLYAYVSRGVLSRVRAPDGRASLVRAEEGERLDRSAVIAAGRNIIAGMVDCLPGDALLTSSPGGPIPPDRPRGEPTPPSPPGASAEAEPVAGRLWSRLCAGNGPGRPAPGLMRA